MKFKYIPGNRPTPMLMYYNNPNIDIFNEFKSEFNFKDKFLDEYKHFWNMNAYLIYDDESNSIKSMTFNSFIYIVYLLRIINKELVFEIDDGIYQIIKNDLNDLKDEIKIICE